MNDYLKLIKNNPDLFHNPANGQIDVIVNLDEIKRIKDILNISDIGIVYKDQYITLLKDLVQFSDKKYGSYIRIINAQDIPRGTAVLPIYASKILLISHFRHSTRQFELEIPRGFGTVGLTSAENIKKELFEEVGGVVKKMDYLGYTKENTGITNAEVDLYMVELSKVGAVDKIEGISKFILVDKKEFIGLANENLITDGFTLTAYAKAICKGLI